MKRLPVVLAAGALLLAASILLFPSLLLGADSGDRAERPADHDSEWFWLHGRSAVADPSRCEDCHEEESCRTCHLTSWPHSSDWQGLHGEEAQELLGRGCSLCHRPAYCDPCHGGVRMPHPRGYVSTHTSSGVDGSACGMCHAAGDCTGCHEDHSTHRSGWEKYR